ncbi:MAG: DUF748 domain-containing protein [Candidatus Omnitrophota bacterium]|nr:DUF748 domain-containing protein [Candidatus Omnitrophota bacterium]
MKILKKIFLIFIAAFIVIFCVGCVFVSIFAKNIIKAEIEKQLKTEASVRSVWLSPPLSLNIGGFTLGDLAEIEKISVTPSFIGLLSGKIVLNNIALIRPQINLERKTDGTFNLPQLPRGGENPVIITGFFIKDGAVSVTDKKVSDEPFSFTIKDINIKVEKGSPLPYPLTIKYALSALLPARTGLKEGKVSGAGLIDWTHKNMQGDFKISDIDVLLFKPYLGDIVSSVIPPEAAQANFNADLSAKNNDLLIKCNFKATPLTALKEAAEADQLKGIEGAVIMLGLGLVKNNQNEVNLEFDIKTKLDNPRFDKITLKGSVFQNILQNALENPEKVTDTVKSIGEQIKEQVKKIDEGDIQQFKEKGKELEKTFKAIFKNSEE